jgi:hypothetical protein
MSNVRLTVVQTAGPGGVVGNPVKVTRAVEGPAYIYATSEPLAADTSDVVFSIWAKAGSERVLRIALATEDQKWLTTTNDPIDLGAQWRRFFVSARRPSKTAKLKAFVLLGNPSGANAGGDIEIFGPQLEPGLTPTEYIPATEGGPHAPRQLQAQMLGGAYIGYGTAAPATGRHARGDIIYNTAPAPGGFVGWVCVEAGSPGVWHTFGAISR